MARQTCKMNVIYSQAAEWATEIEKRDSYTFTIADELFNLHDRQQLIPDRVIFNPPATIVFWKDGTKTVVKASGGDKFDPEKGLAMATIRKIYGSRNKFLKVLEKGDKKCL